MRLQYSFFFKHDRNYEMGRPGHTSDISYLMPYTLTQALSHTINTADAAAASVGAYTYIRLYMYIML